MFCSQCGAEIADGSAFCSRCGAPVLAPIAVTEQIVEAAAEEAAPVIETVEEVAAPVAEAAEEVFAPVAEVVEEAVAPVAEVADEAPAVYSDSVEDALARLRAEMEAAGELESSAPAEPVAQPEPLPAVAPIEPVAAPVEPATYVEPVPVEKAAPVAPAYPEPVAAAPAYTAPTPVQPSTAAYTPAPAPAPAPAPQQPSYTAPAQPQYTAPVQPAYTAPAQQQYSAPAQPQYTAPAQSSYTPPTPVGQPSQGYSYQPAAAAPAPGVQAPAKKSPIAKIAIAAIGLVLVGVIVFLLFGRGGNGGGNSGGGNGGGSSNPPVVSSNTLDSKGNPTLYSVLELSGSELVDVIEDEGFEWNSERKWWVSSDGNDCFYVSSNNDYEYLYNEITSLDVNGKGDSCVYVIVVDDRDYKSASDAFNRLCNVELLDEEWLEEDLGVAAVKGPSGVTNIVLVNVNDDIGLYIINVFNEKAISSGLLEEYLGDDYGDTASEVWDNLFGRSIGSYTGTASAVPTLTVPSDSTVGTLSQGAFGSIAPGTYNVGKDLPAGEYKLYADDGTSGYYAVYPDASSLEISDIISNELFDSCCYVTISDGQYVEFDRCSLDPVASCTPTDTWDRDGVYLIGLDIPAATLTLTPTQEGFSGFYAIYTTSDPAALDDSTVEMELFDEPVEITVEEGQYLSISFCSADIAQ